MARKLVSLLSLTAIGLFLSAGCVSQEKYNALKLDRDRYAEQLGSSQASEAAARAEADAYKNQLTSVGGAGQSKDAMVLNLTNQNNELQRQLDDLNRKYADAVNRTGPSALPAPLTNELTEFARQNPDLVDFDANRGIVKFKSDVTFAPGSAEVTEKAKPVIARFAQILNSPAASTYELIVAGHTDSTNVINPQTKQAGHKDNWFLSSHRAIAVGEELQAHRVAAQRMGMTGYADQRPIASNASESGKAQNRRVEVLILPTQVRSTGGSVASPVNGAKKPNKFNKDAAIPSAAKEPEAKPEQKASAPGFNK